MTKKIKNILKVILGIIIVLIAFVVTVNLVVVNATKSQIVTAESLENADYDCILVLGAGVRTDGSPSYMLEDRIKTSITLSSVNAAPVLLMSGDHSRVDYDEVNCMKDYAVHAGISSDKIFLDHAGFSTYDSIYRARDVFGAKKIVIVTQEYHLYRALYIAKSLGVEAVGVSADLRTYRGQSIHDAREMLARTKDVFFTWFKPKPVYLGDPIDLTGDAAQTNG